MTNLRLSRIFWISAAAILVAAALVALAGVTRGRFGETDAKILLTLLVLLLAGATAISGLALIERRQLAPFAWTAIVLAGICFAGVTWAIWTTFEDERMEWAARMIVLIIGLLIVATQRLMLRSPRLRLLFVATALATTGATLLTMVAIRGDSGGGGLWEPAAVFWILTALGYLLLPVLQRFTAAGAQGDVERVVADLDGVEVVATHSSEGVTVDLHPGERLVLRRRA